MKLTQYLVTQLSGLIMTYLVLTRSVDILYENILQDSRAWYSPVMALVLIILHHGGTEQLMERKPTDMESRFVQCILCRSPIENGKDKNRWKKDKIRPLFFSLGLKVVEKERGWDICSLMLELTLESIQVLSEFCNWDFVMLTCKTLAIYVDKGTEKIENAHAHTNKRGKNQNKSCWYPCDKRPQAFGVC